MDETEGRTNSGWNRKDTQLVLVFSLIIGFCIAILYKPAISYPPANGDDLVLLSKATQVSNPFEYFTSDWGLGNNAYRPLHSISIWMIYQKFGVWAMPNQLLNLGLHTLNLILVFLLLYRKKVAGWIAVLLVILFGSSMYAVSPATWVSDRPTLMVSLSLLVSLILLGEERVRSNWKSGIICAGLSIFALLSKESGLIVPIAIIAVTLIYKKDQSKWVVGFGAVCILAYIFFRFFIFNSQAYDYSESGYLLGSGYYADSSDFPFGFRILVFVDNLLKNISANILLIFGPEGQILSWDDILKQIWMIIPLPVLLGVAVFDKQRPPLRLVAIIILLLNAAVHFQLFRYRALYIGSEAIILLIGSAFVGKTWNHHKRLFLLTTLILFVGIGSNWLYTQEHLSNQLFKRTREINKYELQNVISERGGQLSSEIIQEVLQRYSAK